MTNVDLACVGEVSLAHARELEVRECSVNNLHHVTKIRGLERLDLSRTWNVKDDCVASLVALKRLKDLKLSRWLF